MHAMQVTNMKDDSVFERINKLFIKLDSDNVKEINQHVKKAIDELIKEMGLRSPFFDKAFNKTVWTGSFYKKTKVGSPDEFDLNLVIKLPITEKDVQFSGKKPGYTKIQINVDKDKILNKPEYREMTSFIDQSYLNQEKFRRWMESILNKVAHATDKNNHNHIKLQNYTATIRKSGPAFTLSLQISNQETISIDLVPVLAFSSSQLPHCDNFDSERFRNKSWFAIPKPLKNNDASHKHLQKTELDHYWRLSFYEYEKIRLSNHGRTKPIIRHLKKLRDTQGWENIASYYIETLCFHYLDMFVTSQRISCTSLFFMMLQKLHEAFQNHCIKYYWNKNLNLLENIGDAEMRNMKGRLAHIIKDIERKNANDKYAIARYVLNKKELDILINEVSQSINNNTDTIPKELETESETTYERNCMLI